MKDVVKKAVISVSRLLGGGEEKSTGSVPRKIPLDFQGSSDGAAGDEAERARLSDVVTSLKTIEEQLGRLIKRGVLPAVGKMQVLRFEDLF